MNMITQRLASSTYDACALTLIIPEMTIRISKAHQSEHSIKRPIDGLKKEVSPRIVARRRGKKLSEIVFKDEEMKEMPT